MRGTVGRLLAGRASDGRVRPGTTSRIHGRTPSPARPANKRRAILLATFAVLLSVGSLAAAPVPKEVRGAPSHVGRWQRVEPDPNAPAKWARTGQTWIVNADGDVAFHEQDYRGPPGTPTERLAFDPKTGEVDQSRAGGGGPIRTGRYKIEGDLLTMNLNNTAGAPRPEGFSAANGSTLWLLQRVEGAK